MPNHDPKKHIESLRDHLATYDQPLCFLFGAGTSCSIVVNDSGKLTPLIPAIEPLTKQCKKSIEAMGGKEAEAWSKVEEFCKAAGKAINVENILSNIRTRLDAIGDNEETLGLEKGRVKDIEIQICKTIATSVNPDLSRIPSDCAHHRFANWFKQADRNSPVEIFTTNYDVLFELCLESNEVPVFDGFVGCHTPFFSPESLENDSNLPNSKWVRLWKIHGSITWKSQPNSSRTILTRCPPTETGEMILPSQRKYDESKKLPYTALIDRLSQQLVNNRALLITSGYSFGDEHINAIIFSALESHPGTHVIALLFPDINESDPLVEKAKSLKNLSVYGRNAAVISGEYGPWKLVNPIDDKTVEFMTCGFKVDASSPESLDGKFVLGDFAEFGKFLGTLKY